MMKLTTSIPLLLSLVACATDQPSGARSSKRDAARALAAATRGLDAARDAALGGQASVAAPGAVDIEFTTACARGGRLSIAGTYAYDNPDAGFDLTTRFSACNLGDGQLDGHLRWVDSVAGGAREAITGQLTWQGDDGTASCAFELELADGTSGHLVGTVCGYDVGTELAVEIHDLDL